LTISATGPLAPDGVTTAAPDAYGQAKRCLEIIADVVARAGFSLDDVVKTRIYFRSHADWEQIARAHGEVFSRIHRRMRSSRSPASPVPSGIWKSEAECYRERG
jgi:enamine deaminase RidA (YjgF/YER057c/UK114 family)